MRNQLRNVFQYSGNEVSVIMQDGEPWFVAKDVCKLIGLEQVSRAMNRLDEDDKGLVKVTHPQSAEKLIEVNAVNESGVYQLILDSNKPEAKAFKRWVTHDVLPSIRKHGMYAIDQLLGNPDLLIEVVTKLRDERKARLVAEADVATQVAVIKEQKPDVEYYGTEYIQRRGLR